jgi:hypothetical protein
MVCARENDLSQNTTRENALSQTRKDKKMTKTFLMNCSVAALATAFVFTASLSSANAAGWGDNGQGGSYGGTPGQTQSTPAGVPAQTGGYGGGSGSNGTWGNGRPARRQAGTYGSETYQTNTYPDRRSPGPYFPLKRDTPYTDDNRHMPNTTYEDRRYPGPYFPKRDTYVPRQTYDDRPNSGTYYPQKRDTWGNGGGGYGGSQSPRPTTSSWDNSGGYGGRQ